MPGHAGDALLATLAEDTTGKLRDAQRLAASIRDELEDLHAGRGRFAHAPVRQAATRLRAAENNQHQAQQLADMPDVSCRTRRSRRRAAQAWTEELASARREWGTVAGPTERQLLETLTDADHAATRHQADKARQALTRAAGAGTHARLTAIDRELALIDPQQPPSRPITDRPADISTGLALSP
jgi:hypothetical protein